ncbi:MAG: DUF6111 family protein [Pseudomonadota bacterium]
MARIVIENIVLLLLPTILYFTYIAVMKPKKGSKQQEINDAPFVWLFSIGVVLMIGVLLTFGNMTGHKPGEVYQPPIFRDGKIIPGEYTGRNVKDGVKGPADKLETNDAAKRDGGTSAQ